MAQVTSSANVNVYVDDASAGKSIRQIRQEFRKLNNQIQDTDRESEEYQRQLKRLNQLKGLLNEHNRQVRGINQEWKAATSSIGAFGPIAIAAIASEALRRGLEFLIRGSAELSEQLANVRKTTGLTAGAVDKLANDLGKLNTKTSRRELLALAQQAGKLGISGRDNILQFVKAADQMQVALGEDLGADAITQLGKVADQFGEVDAVGFEQALLKTGSAINELGANSKANEAFITAFTKRIAGVAQQSGLAIDDTLGLASTVDNLGLSAEVSATSISKLLVGMQTDTQNFARIAGQSLQDFEQLLATDMQSALLAVLQGIGGEGGLKGVTTQLKTVGITGTEALQVVSALSGNTELLAEQQGIANKAYEEGNSLTKEYNIQNESLAANLQKIANVAVNSLVGSGLTRWLGEVTGYLADWVATPVSEAIAEERDEINLLVGALIRNNDQQETRDLLIKEINAKYPELLGNLDLEKASAQDLRDALKDVNKQYENKLNAQIIAEEENELVEEQLELQRDIRKQTKEIEALRGRDASLMSQTQYLATQSTIANKEEELAEMEERRLVLQERRLAIQREIKQVREAGFRPVDVSTDGEAFRRMVEGDDNSTGDGGSPSPASGGPSPEGGNGIGTPQGMRRAAQQAQAVMRQMHEQLKQEQAQQRADELNAQKEFNQKRRELMQDDYQRRRQELDQQYERMKQLAKRGNLDMTDVERYYAQMRQAISAQETAERLNTYANFAGSLDQVLSTMNQAIAGDSAKQTGFQKTLVAAQIAIQQAAAIANSIAGASAAAAAGGPAAPFIIAGYIASMTAQVMSGFNQARTTLSDVEAPEVPAFATGGVVRAGGRKRRANFGGSVASGGQIANGQLFLGGEEGPELVIPNNLYTAPDLQPIMSMLEERIGAQSMQAMATGGPTTTSPRKAAPSAGGMDNATARELIAVLQAQSATNAQLAGELKRGITARLAYGPEEELRRREVSDDVDRAEREGGF